MNKEKARQGRQRFKQQMRTDSPRVAEDKAKTEGYAVAGR